MSGRRFAQQFHRPLDVEDGAEPFERRLRSFVFDAGSAPVSLVLVRHAERDARHGRLVGGADTAPDRKRSACRRLRCVPVLLGSRDAGQGELERPVEQRRSLAADPEALGELLQLGGGCLGDVDVADSE